MNPTTTFATFASKCVAAQLAVLVLATQGGELPKVREALFPLSQVRLTGGPLQAQQEQNREYLLRLDPDRLLSRFRLEAGLKPKAEPYNGWESPKNWLDLAGHILGFYMAGAAMTVEATGDEELKRRLLYIVDELEAVQNAHGDGYALAAKDGRKVFNEIASGKINVKINPKTEYCAFINKRFEPIYTLNKVLIGLWRIHVATGSDKAKRVFLRLSDWFGNAIVEKLNDAQLQKVLDCEHASLPETFAVAFMMTGDEKYKRWARRLCHERMLAPLADGNAAHLNFHHANNEIPKYTGFERVYRITGEERLHRAMVNANHAFMYDHAWANGGNSHREHLFPKADFEKKLFMDGGPESCNSVNLLRQIEALFETEPSPDKIDFYERVLFDHLLSTHDPILGRTIYYTPPKPGASRTYSDEFDSMWCCTGTGFEAPGKYGQMIYTHSTGGGRGATALPSGDAVSINLFAPSTLDWKERGVKLRQETAFPYGETSCVKVEAVGKDPKFTVKVRRPAWAGGDFRVYVNGVTASVQQQDGRAVSMKPPHVVSITREWKAGDRIDIEFPMSLRAEYLPGSKKYIAFFYGPTLLVGDLGSEGLKQSDYFAHPPSSNTSSWKLGKPIPMPQVPASAETDPACCLERTTGGPIVFHLKGSDILLKPMYDLHFSRYTMYWRLADPAEEKAFAEASTSEKELAKRAVDSVKIGDAASEKAHGFAGENTNSGTGLYGEHHEYHWRDANSGGFFSYRLSLNLEKPVKEKTSAGGSYVLVAKYCARERGSRTFDVLVDGVKIHTENLIDNKKPAFVFTAMVIPQELIAGKKDVEVRFVPKKGNTAGGLFGLWLVKSSSAPVVWLDKSGHGEYIVAFDKAGGEDWKSVALALGRKHGAMVMQYDGMEGLGGVLAELRKIKPKYVCFVVPPESAGRKFIMVAYWMMRAIDDDPYGDAIWGVITGYSAADGMKIVKAPLHREIRSFATSMGGDHALDNWGSGFASDERTADNFWMKRLGGTNEKVATGGNIAKTLADAFNTIPVDYFVTSGHARERNWQIVYNQNKGMLVHTAEAGLQFVEPGGEIKHSLTNASLKVYVGAGNCLIGHVDRRDCMATAWMHTAGVEQFVGYTVPSWYGFMGWGVKGLHEEGRYSLAEARYLENERLLWAKTRKHKPMDEKGLGYDRDVLAFYGDPAQRIMFPKDKTPYNVVVKGDAVRVSFTRDYSFAPLDDARGARPVMALLDAPPPGNTLLGTDGKEVAESVVTERFIFIPVPGKHAAGEALEFKIEMKEVTPTK